MAIRNNDEAAQALNAKGSKMNGIEKLRKYSLVGLRWTARIYGGLLAVSILAIAIGEGPPNPFTQPLPVAIELFGMLVMLAGCIVGWKWQGVGALLIIVGISAFHVIEKRILLMGAFPLFDIAGILFFWFSY